MIPPKFNVLPSMLLLVKSTGEDYHRKGLLALQNGNDKKAFDYFSQGYGKFYGPCLTELGKMYRYGHYVEKDKNKAMYLFKRGAYNYDEQCCTFFVGELYCRENEESLDAEQTKVLRCIDSSSFTNGQSGFVRQWLIGEMYRLGLGHEKSFERAIHWYNKALESCSLDDLQSADSTSNKFAHEKIYLSMGSIYEKGGNGVEINYELALNSYKKIADEYCAEACNKLGNFYKNGFGVPVNYNEAFRWYFKAATCNRIEIEPCTSSQFNLGLMYQNGWGTKADNDTAMFWFKKAIYGGNKEAGDYVEQIRRKHFQDRKSHLSLLGNPIDHQARLIELEKQLQVTEEKIGLLTTR